MNANECTGCEWEPETQFGFEATAHSDRVRGSLSSRLPTEPCVRVRTRLLMLT